MRLIARFASLFVLVLAAGCGGGNPSGLVPTDDVALTESDVPIEEPPPGVAPISCPDEILDLIESLQELDSRLSIGLTFSEYGDRLGDVRVAYDRIDVDDLDQDCLTAAGIPAESALSAYREAYTLWNDCIEDVDCKNDSIDDDLQDKWTEATDLIKKAREGIDE